MKPLAILRAWFRSRDPIVKRDIPIPPPLPYWDTVQLTDTKHRMVGVDEEPFGQDLSVRCPGQVFSFKRGCRMWFELIGCSYCTSVWTYMGPGPLKHQLFWEIYGRKKRSGSVAHLVGKWHPIITKGRVEAPSDAADGQCLTLR